jgi:hypothetical protein
MPLDAITRIDVLAKASQVGMNFTNMQNELYDDDEDSDSDEDSDDDSDYNYYDASSYDDDDDDYDDLIAGVDMDNPDHLNNVDPDDPEAENPMKTTTTTLALANMRTMQQMSPVGYLNWTQAKVSPPSSRNSRTILEHFHPLSNLGRVNKRRRPVKVS